MSVKRQIGLGKTPLLGVRHVGALCSQPVVSVVIVNYNTRDLLLSCLQSVYASEGIGDPEVFVVDNGSSDGSVEAVSKQFPCVNVISCGRNMGFSRANNLAIPRAYGKYVLLLNPDTRVEKDCLRKMVAFMDHHPEVGISTCKVLLGDGKLDLACRRSFPGLWAGFCRASGLSALFPRSKVFAGYNLTFLDENETHEVEAVNGAFMFCRRSGIDEVGLLDEDYFMYIEDLDWCYRFRAAGWRIAYYPVAVTYHFKGQSSRANSEAMIRELFRSTRLFYRKHYGKRWTLVKRWTVEGGLWLWEYMTLARNALRKEKRTRP